MSLREPALVDDAQGEQAEQTKQLIRWIGIPAAAAAAESLQSCLTL